MSEIMDCDICGGAFLEDYGKCTCDEKKINKLQSENKRLTDRLDRIREQSEIEVGHYTISPHSPIPSDNQKNVIWLRNDKTGEGMSMDVDKLWEQF